MRNAKQAPSSWASMMAGYPLLLTLLGLVLLPVSALQAQVTRNASNFAEFQAAVTASAASGDTINLTNNIVATSATTLSKSLTIRGNGRVISVPVPGLDESGVVVTGASTHRIFTISGASVVVRIEETTLLGANVSGGGALDVSTGATLRLVGSTVTRSRSSAGGGGIRVSGANSRAVIENSRILRNSAQFGGGFINSSSATMHIDRSLIAENRSESANGGGGGGENASATLFVNNTTFSNNQSTEIGGGINNFNGTLFVLNSTFSGNVGYGDFSFGGAIGINNGTVRLVNNLFAYNYVRSAGTVTNPTAFVLSDVTEFNAASVSEARFNIFHATNTIDTTSDNIQYPGLADGSDNTIFSGGLLARLTDGQGNEIGTAQVFRPFLVELPDGRAGTLRIGSYATDFAGFPARRGTPTGYDNSTTPARVGYFNGSAWVAWSGTSPESSPVTIDQLGNTRAAPNIVRGSTNEEIDNVYMLRVNRAAGGTVSGGSLYGDVYPPGTSITLTGLAAAGQQFQRWDCVAGCAGTASTSNPYTFPMPANNLTLVPVFQAQPAGQFTVTYVGNGNTGGAPPSSESSTVSVTIAGPGTLVRSGFTFNGWNTVATGGGTAFTPGQAYSGPANLTLHAQWLIASAPVPPGAPVMGTATAGDGQATVTFTAPSSDGGAAITLYTVTSSPGGFTGTGSSSPITVTGLTNGVSYTFTVTATNSAGPGPASAASNSVTPQAAQTITFANPGAQNFGTTPTLTATSSSGLPVSFSSTTPGVCTITTGGALSFVSTGSCSINADQAGSSTFAPAPTVTQTFAVNAVVPGAPVMGTATAGDGQATVTFTAPSSNGGAAIMLYTVTSSPSGFTGTGSSSPITVTGLTNGVSYTFTVTATNSAGTGPASAASNSVTPRPAFETPRLRPDRVIIREAQSVNIDVLANDFIDPVLRSGLQLSIPAQPSSGSASVVSGADGAPLIRFTSSSSMLGGVSFPYRVCFTAPTPCIDSTVQVEIRPMAVTALEWGTTAERGFRDKALGGLRAMPSARFIAHGLVAPTEVFVSTDQFADAGQPWSGAVGTLFRQLPAGVEARDWRVLVDATATNGDVDLYLGIDTNGNGRADPAELACASAMSTMGERCDLAARAPAAGQARYWILVRTESAAISVRLAIFETPLNQPVAQRSLVATGPGALGAADSFDLRLIWDAPDFLPGQSRGGWLGEFNSVTQHPRC